MRKTSFINCIINELTDKKKKCALFPLQNGRIKAVQSIITLESYVKHQKIITALITSKEVARINDAGGRIVQKEIDDILTISSRTSFTITEIQKEIKDLHEKKNVKYFFIDSLNMIIPDKNYTNYWEMINDFCIILKRLCVELDIAISITADSLRSNTDTMPYTGRSKEAYSVSPVGIAQNADVIICISNNTGEYEESEEKIITVEKNNFNMPGKCILLFIPSIKKFIVPEDEIMAEIKNELL